MSQVTLVPLAFKQFTFQTNTGEDLHMPLTEQIMPRARFQQLPSSQIRASSIVARET